MTIEELVARLAKGQPNSPVALSVKLPGRDEFLVVPLEDVNLDDNAVVLLVGWLAKKDELLYLFDRLSSKERQEVYHRMIESEEKP